MTNTTKPPLLAWGLLILLSIIWGSSFILVKRGLEVFSPTQVASIRVSAGFFCLLIFAIPALKEIPRQKWKYLFLSGITGIFFPAFMFAYAQLSLDSSLTAILNSLTPLFTLLMGVMFFHQSTTLPKTIGVMVALIGSIGLILVSSKSGKLEFNLFALFVVASTISYGFNVNLTKHYLVEIRPLLITTFSLFSIGPIALIALFLTHTPQTIAQHPQSGMALLYLIILGATSTALAMVLFNRMLQIATPIFASSVTYLIPIVAIIWGVMDGERLNLFQFGFMIVILLGVWLVNKREKVILKKEKLGV